MKKLIFIVAVSILALSAAAHAESQANAPRVCAALGGAWSIINGKGLCLMPADPAAMCKQAGGSWDGKGCAFPQTID